MVAANENDRPREPEATQGDGEQVPVWLEAVADERAPGGSSRRWLVAAGIGVVVLFAGLLWFVYDRTGGRDDQPPVLVQAPDGPVKTEPEDRGGIDVPDQDKLVFERMAGEEVPAEEALAAVPEEPVVPPPGSTEGGTEGEGADQASAEDVAPPPPLPTTDGDQETATEAASAAVTAEPETPAPTQPEPRAKPVPVTVVPSAVQAEVFRIQVGAFGSRASAEGEWRRLTGRFSTALAGLSPDVEALQRSGRSLYRLRAGPLSDRAAARDVCERLKAGGQACIVVAP